VNLTVAVTVAVFVSPPFVIVSVLVAVTVDPGLRIGSQVSLDELSSLKTDDAPFLRHSHSLRGTCWNSLCCRADRRYGGSAAGLWKRLVGYCVLLGGPKHRITYNCLCGVACDCLCLSPAVDCFGFRNCGTGSTEDEVSLVNEFPNTKGSYYPSFVTVEVTVPAGFVTVTVDPGLERNTS
jgi:hypothetical protein